jgi:hypothetical protein
VYYGRDFDVQKHGIQMEPWNIVTKVSTYAIVSRKAEGFVCLSISAQSIVVER